MDHKGLSRFLRHWLLLVACALPVGCGAPSIDVLELMIDAPWPDRMSTDARWTEFIAAASEATSTRSGGAHAERPVLHVDSLRLRNSIDTKAVTIPNVAVTASISDFIGSVGLELLTDSSGGETFAELVAIAAGANFGLERAYCGTTRVSHSVTSAVKLMSECELGPTANTHTNALMVREIDGRVAQRMPIVVEQPPKKSTISLSWQVKMSAFP